MTTTIIHTIKHYITQHKAIPYKVVNAPKNPFEAMKKASQKTEQSGSPCSGSSVVQSVDTASQEDVLVPSYDTDEGNETKTSSPLAKQPPKSDSPSTSEAMITSPVLEKYAAESSASDTENESENEPMRHSTMDESPRWLTCAGELSYLVKKLNIAYHLRKCKGKTVRWLKFS